MNPIANEIELEALPDGPFGKPVMSSALPYLESVRVQVSVRVGGIETTVAELLALKQGAVLELDRLVEEPLDVMVGGHVVARGTLVAVGEQFGVRLTEIATTAAPTAQNG